MVRWRNQDDADAFLGSAGAGLIVKHSTRCPISAGALREVEAFAREQPAAPVFLVYVIEDRPISSAIAEKLGVPHASPQALLVRNGAVAWEASHDDITRDALREAWLREGATAR